MQPVGIRVALLAATFSLAPSFAWAQILYPPSSTADSTVNTVDDSTRTVNSTNSGSTNGLPVILYTNDGYNINVTSLAGSVVVAGIPTANPSVNAAVIYQSVGMTATSAVVGSQQWDAGDITVNDSATIVATNVNGSNNGPGGLLVISQGANGYGIVQLAEQDNYGNQPFAGTWGGNVTVSLQDSGSISVTGLGSGTEASFLTPTLTGISASSIGGNGTSGAYEEGGIHHTIVPFYGNGGGSRTVTVTTEQGTSIEVTQSGPGTNAVGISALARGGTAGSYYDGGASPPLAYYANGGSAGAVSVTHDGSITVNAEVGIGILASSVGGNGTDGDVPPTNSGGGRPGDGGSVTVEQQGNGSITMTQGGIGILAISQAGNWDPLGDSYLPSGGQVNVTVDDGATIQTGTPDSPSANPFSFGILAISSGNPLVVSRAFSDSLTGSGVAGDVAVANSGSITTFGNMAIGIAALGIGGTPAVVTATDGLGTLGNSGSILGASGSEVNISNEGSITTLGLSASGIVAISSGGGGIIKNDAAAETSADGSSWVSGIAIGANTNSDAPATDGGDVTVTNAGSITTGDGLGNGVASLGIIAQSIGGSGGTAGGESGLRNLGDMSGSGGAAGSVTVNLNDGSAVTTQDKNSHAVLIQSIGGGGGNAANASGGFVAVGGEGGAGGNGNTASFSASGEGIVRTLGNYSTAVVVQSIGGGGGNGGMADSAGAFVSHAIGGMGGQGGSGGTANASNASTISTQGNQSAGIIVQSIGGGGGIGGFANSFSAGFIFDLATAVGGRGGNGGNGYDASVINQGSITTGVAPGSFDNSTLVNNTGVLYGTLADGTYFGSVLIESGSISNGVFTGTIGNVTLANGDVIENATISGMTISGTINGVATTQTLKNGGLAGALVANASNDTLNGLFLNGKIVTGFGTPNQNGADSIGMIVQSIGGGGGIAGSASAKSLVLPLPSPGLDEHPPTISYAIAVGGAGGDGGEGGIVTAQNVNSITTYGDGSLGILAQSIGGGGGIGGDATATSKAIEGQGSDLQVSIGAAGSGGTAGSGATVTVENGPTDGSGGGSIVTFGQNAAGILAQSIGGGGGSGGTGNAGTSSPYLHNPTGDAFALSIAVGGGAGSSGSGGSVTVNNNADSLIATFGSTSQGIMAQSIGGGGGNGGGGSSSGAGDKISLDVSIGGDGAGGGDGGDVTVENDGTIITSGGDSTGILAQSIGGGGGTGGTSDAGATATPTTVQVVNGGAEIIQKYLIKPGENGSFGGEVSLGGDGGAAGYGGVVIVSNRGGTTQNSADPGTWSAGILTAGARAYGILAQSIGGGGGLGGTATSTSRSATDVFGINPNPGTEQYTASIKIGGNAATEASTGNYVTATNYGVIATHGYGSAAIVAQSIGGGGGVGADGSVDTDVSQFLGASAGGDNAPQEGGGMTANNDPNAGLFTTGRDAAGIIAQSIGGGGGIASTGVDAFETIGGGQAGTVSHVMTLGQNGSPAANNTGGVATVNQKGFISTTGDWSHGVVVQSIGAGGGKASAYSTASVVPYLSMTLGANGQQGDSSNVYLNLIAGNQISTGSQVTGSNGSITRTGYSAFGILAQSIAGGGGLAADLSELAASATGEIQVGGQSSGEAGEVSLTGTSSIITYGDVAHAIVLQSISGGGGVGGAGSSLGPDTASLTSGVTVNVSGEYAVGNGNTVSIDDSVLVINTFGANAYGLLAQSIGGGGGLGFAQNSTAIGTLVTKGIPYAYGSDGGTISLNLNAGSQIVTRGDGAHAIVAQSIGGGGGIANYSSGTPTVTTLLWGDSVGIGDGGTVSITSNGTIYTTGAGAFGILAQSIGGGGGLIGSDGSLMAGTSSGGGNTSGGGDVAITQNGTLQVTGTNSVGIFAQSNGPWPSSGTVTVTVNGLVSGGAGEQGFGIWVDGGNLLSLNEITIAQGGLVTAASGQAINYTGENGVNVTNDGEVAGSVSIGSGTFVNNGTYSPGSTPVAPPASLFATAMFAAPSFVGVNPVNVDGNYVQTRKGTLLLNFTSAKKRDYFHATGSALFEGKLRLNLPRGFTADVLGSHILLEADGGLTTRFSRLESSLPSLSLRLKGGKVIVRQDFANLPGARYTGNQKNVARHLDDRARDPLKGRFLDLLSELHNLSTEPEAVADAFSQLSPEAFNQFVRTASINNATFFTQQLGSYTRRFRSFEGDFLRPAGGLDISGLSISDSGTPSLLTQIENRLAGKNPSPVGEQRDASTQNWNTFLQGNVILAQGFSQPGIAHSDSTTGAVQFGVDYRLAPSLIVGAYGGYDHTEATLDARGSSGKMETYRTGLYAAYSNQGWYANAVAGWGWKSLTSDRRISFGSYNGVAHAEPDGSEWLANLDAGYDFRAGGWTFGPTAGLQFTRFSVDRYTETGAPGANLAVEDQGGESLRSRLGGRASYTFQGETFAITPHLDVSWQHDFLDESEAITSQFVSTGRGSFTVQTPGPSRDSVLVGVGVAAEFNRRTTLFVDYWAQAGQADYFGQTIMAGMKIRF